MPYHARTIMATPWATTIGPLALAAYHPLPVGSRKNFPKFSSDGKVTTDKHIKAFFEATHIVGVVHEDVAMRLFVETLIESAIDWFYHLDDGSIIDWNMMRTKFEARFKTTEDGHVLLTPLASIKKQPNMSMRDFVASFKKITNRILIATRPTAGNLKTFFISVMSPEINYDLRRARPTDLVDAQRRAIECEDDIITAGK